MPHLPSHQQADRPVSLNWSTASLILLVHLAPLGAIWTGVRRRDIAVGIALYAIRGFCVAAGYHRLFTHASYQAGRLYRWVMAFAAMTSAQGSVIWWVFTHRVHHQHADKAGDLHSPHDGFWWAHVLWLLRAPRRVDERLVRDLLRDPFLRFLHRFPLLPPFALGTAVCLTLGWSGVWTGFFLSTVLLYHLTWIVNSLAHSAIGRKYFRLEDNDSRNVPLWGLLAIFTFGEIYHEAHHQHPTSVKLALLPGEIDLTYYGLALLRRLGLVWDLNVPSPDALRASLRPG